MDPPPSYSTATSTSVPTNTTGSSTNTSSNLAVPRNGIPPMTRRSMEDEQRELPQGWIRQFDPQNQHQFFVDTTQEPPRSTWQHPYDDETYLNSLSTEERERVQSLHKLPSHADIIAESSDEDEFHNPALVRPGSKQASTSQSQGQEHFPEQLPRRDSPPPTGLHKFGRKMKDKITSTTHVEREQYRQKRAEEEERMYREHQMYRAAMARAAQTGVPQLIGKDRQGRDVYIEPPYGHAGGPIGGGGPYPGQGGFGHGGVGYNPYVQGPYAAPNARFIRPQGQYYRPYGSGYGGGLGLPIGLGIGAGLLTGSLLF